MGALGKHEMTVDIDGKQFTFEAGKIAAQAGGAVVVTLGDTKVLTTTTATRMERRLDRLGGQWRRLGPQPSAGPRRPH